MSANTQADCTTPQIDPATGAIETQVGTGSNSAVATNSDARYVIIWQSIQGTNSQNSISAIRVDTNGTCLGDQAELVANDNWVMNQSPTLAMNGSGHAAAAFITSWSSHCSVQDSTALMRVNEFDFGDPAGAFSVTSLPTFSCAAAPGDTEPSIGLDANGCRSVAWSNFVSNTSQVPQGLWLQRRDWLQQCQAQVDPIRACTLEIASLCFLEYWKPCVAVRSDGFGALVWADAEDALSQFTRTDIKLQVFGAGWTSSEVPVNDPLKDQPNSFQLSSAVAFDGTGNSGRIVVTWVGPPAQACPPGAPSPQVYARVFSWTAGNDPVPATGQFVVNDDPLFQPYQTPNPTVSFATDAQNAGRFVVAWNAQTPEGSGARKEVHARLFNSANFSIGKEFRVNRATSVTDPQTSENSRLLGASAQHTCVFDPLGRIVATWTALTDSGPKVHVTILPVTFLTSACCTELCCRGDFNHDGHVDGLDIQAWLFYLFLGASPYGNCLTMPEVCVADANGDCVLNNADHDGFVCLLTCSSPCIPCAAGGGDCRFCTPDPTPDGMQAGDPADSEAVAFADCNSNGVQDWSDIAAGSSPDCNLNGKPDECDLAFDPMVTDFNRNFIPDDCESVPQTGLAVAQQAIDRDAVAPAISAWLASIDLATTTPWEVGYQLKLKFNELGIDVRTLGHGQ